jgi:hypothetical protein
MNHECPVCGFEAMPYPPEDHNICSCCGTEFGYHDLKLSHEELFRRWWDQGAPWFSTALPKPAGWTAAAQVERMHLRRKDHAPRIVAS